MKGLKGWGLGLLAVAAVVGALALAATVSAISGEVSIGSATAAPGAEASVDLAASVPDDPGLGAWTLDITYDPSVVSVADCSPEEGGVCNPAYTDDTVRVTGASATGLVGDTTLATITFECGDAEGESDLSISINVLADATIGAPADIDATTSDGSITCAEPTPVPPTATLAPRPPIVGTGGSDGGGLGWLIAALAGAGAVALVGVVALRLRPRRP